MDTIREKIGRSAIDLVTGDRQKEYGPPSECLAKTAEIFNAVKGQTLLTAADVALVNIAQKLARDQNKYKRDNYRDAVGYLLIKAELEETGYGAAHPFDLLDQEGHYQEDENEGQTGGSDAFDSSLGQFLK